MRGAAALVLLLVACRDATNSDANPRFVAISAGMYHTCALTERGKAFCWGRNLYGGLGDGTTTASARPVAVAASLSFVTISAGWDYSCGLTANGGAVCWGANFGGQLGDGTRTHRYSPVAVLGGLTFSALTTGEAHTCAITTAGETYCWGAPLSPYPPPGGMPPDLLVPTRLNPSRMAAVSVGYEIACGITTSHALYCWGLVPPGIPAPDSSTSPVSPTPLLVTSSTALVQVSAAWKHACGVDTVGQVLCWGQNLMGEVGDSSYTNAAAPTLVSGTQRFQSVSAHSAEHSCGITVDGAAFCWGDNRAGELGAGSAAENSNVPLAVAGHRQWTAITTGALHTCGLTTEGDAFCWGAGRSGQLGTGEFNNTREPVAVIP